MNSKAENEIHYRLMHPGEEERVSLMTLRTFDEFVAPGFTEEGNREIHRFFSPEAIRSRDGEGHFVLVAESSGKIVGTFEIKDNHHICMLFVDRDHLRRGIATELMRRGLEMACSAENASGEFTVNSSPYAVPVYKSLGFVATGDEQTENGMRIIPMRKSLQE